MRKSLPLMANFRAPLQEYGLRTGEAPGWKQESEETMSVHAVVAPATDTASTFRIARTTAWYSKYKLLILLVFLMLPLRLNWMLTKTPVISLEGSEYVRMAENLGGGKGLTGNFEGPETMYTPLYSVLVAGLYRLIGNSELAAHLVSLFFGTALIIPVFFIALRMYGTRVAYLSAGLVAFHPLLIALSGSIYNENVYLPLLLAGVYFGMRALELRKNRDYVLLALFLGLAYLTRPEAFAYPIFFVLTVWASVILARLPVRKAVAGSALIVGTFLVVASPYVSFLYAHTGHLRLEGKWNINYTIANRILSGMNNSEAAYGLGPHSSVAGPLLDPFFFASYTPYPRSLAAKVETLWAMAKRNRKVAFAGLSDLTTGGPLFWGLALLGLFRKSWNSRRLFHECIIGCMVCSVLILLCTSSHCEFRYTLPLFALSVMWVAKGIDESARWVRGSVRALQWRYVRNAETASVLVAAGLAVALFGVAYSGVRKNWLFTCEQAGYANLKQAGLWLRNVNPGPKRIASLGGVLTYYAHGTKISLPYAESSQTLRYLDLNRVDFVVLDSYYATGLPEVADWIRNGVPDSRAYLVYKTGTDITNTVEIYRWDKPSRITH